MLIKGRKVSHKLLLLSVVVFSVSMVALKYFSSASPSNEIDKPIHKVEGNSSELFEKDSLVAEEYLSWDPNNTVDPESYSTLAGTDIDGGLTVNEQGHFVPDQNALTLFDYFFQLSGEVADEAIVNTVKQLIAQNLQQPAMGEVLAFFDQYLEYRQLAEESFFTEGNLDDYAERYQLLLVIRTEIFGEQLSRQLYGDDEQLLNRLENRERLQDPGLTLEEKSVIEEEMVGQLSNEEQVVYQRSQDIVELSAMNRSLKEQRASEEDVYQAREEIFGEEAAQRLQALDQQRVLWQQRYDDYREQRAAIERNTHLSELEKQQEISSLQLQSFDQQELLRVRALDQI